MTKIPARIPAPEPNGAADRTSMLLWTGLLLLAAAAAAGLVEPIAALFRHVVRDDNEGWNAFFAQIAVSGGDLYPRGSGFITNNYPPLSFYIVGLAGRLLGDNIIAGRLIALIALFVVTLNLFLWLRETGSTRRLAGAGAASFLALAVTYAPDYVAMNDPQWLAHAVMTTGMVVLWRGRVAGIDSGSATLRTPFVVAALLLMLAAGCIKHLLIPLPVATTLWLLWYRRGALWLWLACALVALALVLATFWGLYGVHFFESINSARVYRVAAAIKASITAFKCFAPILLLSAVAMTRFASDERTRFVAAYLVLSGGIGAVATGGTGVEVNAFFDLLIAGSLGAALGLEVLGTRRMPTRVGTIALAPVATLLLGLSLAAYATTKAKLELEALSTMDSREQATRSDIGLISKLGRGRAACESLALCYWAGSAFTLDYFNFGQAVRTGELPASACEAALGPANASLLQLGPGERLKSRQLPESCNDYIRRNTLEVTGSRANVLLVPLNSDRPGAGGAA